MNASAFKDSHYAWYLKIVLKLHEPLGECNLNTFFKYHEYSKTLVVQAFIQLLNLIELLSPCSSLLAVPAVLNMFSM